MDPKEYVHNTDWLLNTRLRKTQRSAGAGAEKGQGHLRGLGGRVSTCQGVYYTENPPAQTGQLKISTLIVCNFF